MSAPLTGWQPGRNAVHRLIQLTDVLATALHRYRQLSFLLPPDNVLGGVDAFFAARNLLWDDWQAVTAAVFPREDMAPQYTAKRLADAALAELVRAGLPHHQPAVGDAFNWLSAVGWLFCPETFPRDPSSERHEAFKQEGELLFKQVGIRQTLLTVISLTGHVAPPAIYQRTHLATKELLSPGVVPTPNAVLLEWVRETTDADTGGVARPPKDKMPAALPRPGPSPPKRSAQIKAWEQFQADLSARGKRATVDAFVAEYNLSAKNPLTVPVFRSGLETYRRLRNRYHSGRG